VVAVSAGIYKGAERTCSVVAATMVNRGPVDASAGPTRVVLTLVLT
jgi:hypothetical protein